MAPLNFNLLLLMSTIMMTCFLFREAEGHFFSRKKKPNIIFIMVDDLGWSDLGVHDGNMVTPNLDRMYNEAFRFKYSYTDPVGSSSRAAFFSGSFAYKMGLQHDAINKFSSGHIPINRTILPMTFRYNGYETHLVGKWDQGFCNLDQTPTRRGFDTFFGHYTNSIDHTTKMTEEGFYDFRDGEDVMTDTRYVNMYNTDAYAKKAVGLIKRHKRKYPDNEHPFFLMLSFGAIRAPNGVPDKYIRKCRKGLFSTEERKVKCGMMAAVDLAIFKVVRALETTEFDHNTLVFFTSDNGGDSTQGSSNWPLRGSKGSVWEGGIRVPSFIWSEEPNLLPVMNHTYQGMFHVVDWYPTLIGFMKRRGKPYWPARIAPAMDGRNHWRLIKRGVKRSFRTEFAYVVNETEKTVAYIRQGHFKMVVDETDSIGWYSPPYGFNESTLEEPRVNYRFRPFLMYNIRKDPNETRDLSKSRVPKNAAAREALLDLWADVRDDYVSKYRGVVNSSPANHPEYDDIWSPGSC